MRIDPIRVLVWAAYPALQAGLCQLARAGGFEVCELSALGLETPLDGGGAADVLLADVANTEAVEAALVLAARLRVAPVLVIADDAALLDRPGGFEGPHALLTRATGADALATAIRGAVAGLVVLDPVFIGAPPPDGAAESVPAPSGATPLTRRELEVLEWIALGLPNKAIALRLGISEHTVKFHVGSVLSKLDARSRAEAVSVAARRGLLAL